MSTSAALIKLQGVGKSYPKVHKSRDRMRALWKLLRGRQDLAATEVLGGIDLEVFKGQSYGIIGENGAGKSTLLKLISGVITPSSGRVETSGRIAALLELGAGFHPEYTGRENITLASLLIGMSNQEIEKSFADIVAFADIGAYIDEPVKHYSSGMVVRLGFAVVAASKPDLLITDEVLAVGDESFQRKCIAWIEAYLADGGTLLLVSHSMYHIQKLCRHACWLENGRIKESGEVFRVTQAYLAWHKDKSAKQLSGTQLGNPKEYHVKDYIMTNDKGQETDCFDSGDNITIKATLYTPDGKHPNVLIGIVQADGTAVYGVTSDMDGQSAQVIDDQHIAYQLCLTETQLLPGSYKLRTHAMDPEGIRLYDTHERRFYINGKSRELGSVRLSHQWQKPKVRGKK